MVPAPVDAEPAEQEHHHGGGHGRDHPPGVVAPAELRLEGAGDDVTEDQEQQRRHQRLDKGVAPADQEPDGRVQPAGGVGVEAAGRGELLGELPDGDGDQQAADQREQHRQRQRAGGEVGADDDREGDRGRRGHVGDGLEQDFPQADGLAREAGGRAGLGHEVLLVPPPAPANERVER
jgi:hypothetical protein